MARHLFREPARAFNLPPELWLFLQNLDRRLENLTSMVEEVKSQTLLSGTNTRAPLLHSHSALTGQANHPITATHLPLERQHSQNSGYNSDESTEPQDNSLPDENDPLSSVLPQMPATPIQANSVSVNRMIVIRSEASSVKNFAVKVLREICTGQELVGRNICGVRGKQAVDPSKVEQIKGLVKRYYPAPPCESELSWRECRKAMDSYLRKLPRPN